MYGNFKRIVVERRDLFALQGKVAECLIQCTGISNVFRTFRFGENIFAEPCVPLRIMLWSRLLHC